MRRDLHKLLNALHIGFNGQPDWIDRNAVSVMFEFKNCIEELLQQPAGQRSLCRPRFLMRAVIAARRRSETNKAAGGGGDKVRTARRTPARKAAFDSKLPCHPVCRSRSAMPLGARRMVLHPLGELRRAHQAGCIETLAKSRW